MKKLLACLAVITNMTVALAVTPDYYTCTSKNGNFSFVFIEHKANGIKVANRISSKDWRSLTYVTVFSGEGNESYSKLFGVTAAAKKIMPATVDGLTIPASMLFSSSGKAKKGSVRLVAYNNPSRFDYVVKSESLLCTLTPASF
ncbi:MAG TPA: hypothetical protein VNJ01_04840 [Bacteriovoracaceae bacterium]|nr:hypothetical protein [Bacteriovoracaceae bacterium]